MIRTDNRRRHIVYIRELGATTRARVRSASRRTRLIGYMTLDYPDCTTLDMPLTTVGAATWLAYDYRRVDRGRGGARAADGIPGV